jgi:hypothetical protein
MSNVSNEQVRNAIKELAGKSTTCKVGMVKSVQGTQTCTVELPEEADLVGVRFKAADNHVDGGIVAIPKVGTSCLIVFIGGSEDEAFLAMADEVDQYIIMGGGNDGLVKVNELVSRINRLENKVNEIIGVHNSHIHPFVGVTPATPASTAPTAMVVDSVITPLTSKNDLENTKVKH